MLYIYIYIYDIGSLRVKCEAVPSLLLTLVYGSWTRKLNVSNTKIVPVVTILNLMASLNLELHFGALDLVNQARLTCMLPRGDV